MEALAAQVSDPGAAADVHFLRGDRAWVRGDFDAAYDEMVRAAEFSPLAAVYLSAAVRPALWLRDAIRARAAAERLDADPSARRHRARAPIAPPRGPASPHSRAAATRPSPAIATR